MQSIQVNTTEILFSYKEKIITYCKWFANNKSTRKKKLVAKLPNQKSCLKGDNIKEPKF